MPGAFVTISASAEKMRRPRRVEPLASEGKGLRHVRVLQAVADDDLEQAVAKRRTMT
jgi:hypothetical protein